MPGTVGHVGSGTVGTAVGTGIGPRSNPRSPPWPRSVAKTKVIKLINHLREITQLSTLFFDLLQLTDLLHGGLCASHCYWGGGQYSHSAPQGFPCWDLRTIKKHIKVLYWIISHFI